MRKTRIFLAVVGLALACSVVVYAGAQKITLVNMAPAGSEHANANGFVVVNKTPAGATDVTIQIQIRDAVPEYEYVVKSLGDELGRFTTNRNGSGGLHINLADEADLNKVNIRTPVGNMLVLQAVPE